jgi:hypothetical protein
MKKIIIIVLAVVVALIGTILIGANFAPKEFKVEREIAINKPEMVVFDYLKIMKNAENWSPLLKKDPRIVRQYKGVDGEVGATMSWSGDAQVGTGEQEIKNIIPGQRIDYELRMTQPFKETFPAYLITEKANDNETKVRWGFSNQIPVPMNLFCMFMNADQKIGKDFEVGLNKLKTILENN